MRKFIFFWNQPTQQKTKTLENRHFIRALEGRKISQYTEEAPLGSPLGHLNRSYQCRLERDVIALNLVLKCVGSYFLRIGFRTLFCKFIFLLIQEYYRNLLILAGTTVENKGKLILINIGRPQTRWEDDFQEEGTGQGA